MASVNKVILVGNLGRDPDVRGLPNGESVANIAIATSNKYKNRAGEMVDETEWHNAVLFGRLAEIAGKYLKKGSSIYVEGRLKTEKYTDKNGVEKYQTKVIVGELKMLGGRSAGENEPHVASSQARQQNAQQVSKNPQQGGGSGFNDMDDDIPF
jgi:single-strand DNA-binding protein